MRNARLTPLLLSTLVGLLAVGLLAGCSASVSVGGDKWDAGKAEKEISKGVESQNKGVKVKSVSCPADVSTDKGTKTTCDVVLQGGQKATAHITVTGGGSFTYNVN